MVRSGILTLPQLLIKFLPKRVMSPRPEFLGG